MAGYSRLWQVTVGYGRPRQVTVGYDWFENEDIISFGVM